MIQRHTTLHITHNTHHTRPTLSLYSNSISNVDTLLCCYQKRSQVSAQTAREDAVVLSLGRTLEAKVPSPPFPPRSLSVSLRTEPNLQGPHAAFPSPSAPRNISTFLVFAKPPEARLLHLLFRSFDSIKILCFYILSDFQSAASAVLKRMSKVIAIAHVLFVSIKSLSVSTMLL